MLMKKERKPTCHPDREYYAKGLCHTCYNRENKRERMKDPKNKNKHNLSARTNRRAYYGITDAEFDEMMKEQGGVCAICERPPKTRSLDIDHEHQSKEKTRSPESRKKMIRGLLCHKCNRALGLFGNDINKLLLASHNFSIYIEKCYAKRLYETKGSSAIDELNEVIDYLERYEKEKAEFGMLKVLKDSKERL